MNQGVAAPAAIHLHPPAAQSPPPARAGPGLPRIAHAGGGDGQTPAPVSARLCDQALMSTPKLVSRAVHCGQRHGGGVGKGRRVNHCASPAGVVHPPADLAFQPGIRRQARAVTQVAAFNCCPLMALMVCPRLPCLPRRSGLAHHFSISATRSAESISLGRRRPRRACRSLRPS
jgi:hypothetical protein